MASSRGVSLSMRTVPCGPSAGGRDTSCAAGGCAAGRAGAASGSGVCASGGIVSFFKNK